MRAPIQSICHAFDSACKVWRTSFSFFLHFGFDARAFSASQTPTGVSQLVERRDLRSLAMFVACCAICVVCGNFAVGLVRESFYLQMRAGVLVVVQIGVGLVENGVWLRWKFDWRRAISVCVLLSLRNGIGKT